MIKISVIIPCLNTAKYIAECLRSIQNQTEPDFEAIVIDAGSTDGSLDIIEAFAREDARIRLYHSDRKSYGYQVNMGLALAAGEYISLVDADDRIVPNMYELLYPAAVSSGADYVKGTAWLFYSLGEAGEYRQRLRQFPKERYAEVRIEVCPHDMPGLLTMDNFLWYGIYRREFLQGVSLHESPGAAFQDFGALLQTQMRAKKALYLPDAVYEYRQGNAGASSYNPRGLHFVADEYSWAERMLEEAPDQWKKAFYKKLFFHTKDRFFEMAASGSFWRDAESDCSQIARLLEMAAEKGWFEEGELAAEDRAQLRLFLTDPKLFYQQYREEYQEVSDPLLLLLEKIDREPQIVIFGSGQAGIFLHAQLLYRNRRQVAAYCDNACSRQGASLYGIPILAPETAAQQYREACYVVANRRSAEEMKRQLIELGVSGERIICYTAAIDRRLFGVKTEGA